MAEKNKIYTSGTSDKLLVIDPNETPKSRTINANPVKNAVNSATAAGKVNIPNTVRTGKSITKRLQIKDVLLSSKRDKVLDLLKIGARKDLLDGIKRLLPKDYAKIVDNLDILLSGKKQLFGTQSGDRWYGLEEIEQLKDLFELRRQWDDYERAKDREDSVRDRDRATEATMAQSIVLRYMRLSNPIDAIDFLNNITDSSLKIKVCKGLLFNSVTYSQLTLTLYIVNLLTPTYVSYTYPKIINDIFTYYVNDYVFSTGINNLTYMLTLCDLINPDFLKNKFNQDHYNLDLLKNISDDAYYIITTYNKDVADIVYGTSKTISRSTLISLADVSKKYKAVDFYSELESMYPNRV